jgi:hypothetical protein
MVEAIVRIMNEIGKDFDIDDVEWFLQRYICCMISSQLGFSQLKFLSLTLSPIYTLSREVFEAGSVQNPKLGQVTSRVTKTTAEEEDDW